MDQLRLSALATHFSTLHEIEVEGETREAIAFPERVLRWFSDEALGAMLEGTSLQGQLQRVKEALVTMEEVGPPSIDPAEPSTKSQPISHGDISTVKKTRNRVLSLANVTIRGLTKLRFLLASMSLILERKPVEVMYPQIESFEEISLTKVSKIYDPSIKSFDTIKMLNNVEKNTSRYTYDDDDVVREEARKDRGKIESSSHVQTALDKIRTLRNNYLAHNDPKRQDIREAVKELEIALSEICLLYDLAEAVVEKYLLYFIDAPLEPEDKSTEQVTTYYEAFQEAPRPKDEG